MSENWEEKILNIYIQLLEEFEGDKHGLKKINKVFDEPLQEINNQRKEKKQ